MELNIFHIEYELRTTIKGQVLTDFIAEFTDSPTGPIGGGQQEGIFTPVSQPTGPTEG